MTVIVAAVALVIGLVVGFMAGLAWSAYSWTSGMNDEG